MHSHTDNQEITRKDSRFNPFAPLVVISKQTLSFFLWVAFSLIGGAIGIIVNCVRRWLFEDVQLLKAIADEGGNGSFYTYSIALIASVLSSVFINFVEKKEVQFRKFKIPVITIAIYLLFFGGVMYTLFMGFSSKGETARSGVMEWGQVVMVVVAITLSVYAFCVCRMDNEALRPLFKKVEDHYFDDNNDNAFDDNIPSNIESAASTSNDL